jgi:glutamate dehydrogenase (NADP+)
MNDMLTHAGNRIEGKRAVVSGSGNVALYAMEKLAELGAIPITASDSGGFVHDPDGITGERLEWLQDLKENRRGRISEYADEFGCDYHPDAAPWSVPCDLAFPCATQNELGIDDAHQLISNGLVALAEGANMPTELAAIHALQDAKVLFAPSKAANAGGVAVSGLEQSQNSQRISWSREEVDARLQSIMSDIHDQCVSHSPNDDRVDYVGGANIAGFTKVADAMLAFGYV